MTSKANPAAAFLTTHAWKNATVQLDGDEHDACFFDWLELEAKDGEKIAKGKALPEDQHEQYFGHLQLWTSDFDQYFAGEQADKIEDGDWLPLAVLGLGNATTLENFAEMNNEGFLALVIGGDGKPGSVVWYNQDDDEVRVVADSVDDLEIEIADSNGGDDSEDD